MYTVDGVVNLLNQTLNSGLSHKAKGMMSSNSPTPGSAFIKEGKIHILISKDSNKMIHLHKSSSQSALDGVGHCASITDSDIMRGGIPLSTAGHEEMSESGVNSENHKDRSAIKA